MKTLAYITAMTAFVLATSAVAAPKNSRSSSAGPAKKIDFAKDVDGLGGNEDLMKMANTLNPEAKSRIVQDRIVDRRNRLEVGINYGGNMGGTTYLETQNFGASLDFHITPKWAIGGRYLNYGSKLTPEGQRIFDDYRDKKSTTIVDIDTPQNAAMAIVSWFPVYGKTNFFDLAVAQFDVYVLAGGGQITLESGPSTIMTGGVGVGLWMTRHLTARAEVRFQSYDDVVMSGPRTINSAAATVGLGWIL